MERTVSLHCRIPESVYNAARRAAPGSHQLGAFVAQAIVNEVTNVKKQDSEEIAQRVVAILNFTGTLARNVADEVMATLKERL